MVRLFSLTIPLVLAAMLGLGSISAAGERLEVAVYRILDLLVARRLVERLSLGDRSFRLGRRPSS